MQSQMEDGRCRVRWFVETALGAGLFRETQQYRIIPLGVLHTIPYCKEDKVKRLWALGARAQILT